MEGSGKEFKRKSGGRKKKGKREVEKSQEGEEERRHLGNVSAFSFGLSPAPYHRTHNGELVSHRLSPPSDLLLNIALPL